MKTPNIKHQRLKNLHIPNSNTRFDDLTRRRDGRCFELGAFICSLRKLVCQFGYFLLLHFYERHKLFHFRRKPANARIAMIAAARLRRPVAAEERPVLRTPVIEPEPVLRPDSLTETFERRVGPGTVLVRLARVIGESTATELPGTDARHPCMTARCELKAVFGQAWLAVSRISHEKRVDLLVETFRRLPHEKLLVVGGAQLGVSAERFIRSLNPPANVEFLGEIPEPRLRELYATCRGLVATSRDEDFGLAPLEAMASGKVVIAVNDGGYRESIVDGETGWLVPPTAESIAKAIARGTPDLLGRMRSACEKRARSFDSALFVERMRALIEASVRGS